jgi:phage terminase large subunit-like protein
VPWQAFWKQPLDVPQSKDGAQNDSSVCTTWMIVDKSYYLIDLTRGRYEYPRLKASPRQRGRER